MQIAIHKKPGDSANYAPHWARFVEKHGGAVCWVDLTAPHALDGLRGVDGIMWQFRRRFRRWPAEKDLALRVLTAAEFYMGVPCFPDFRTHWHYDCKAAQYYLFRTCEIPTPRTWVFWRQSEACEWARSATYPVVFKTCHGAASEGVCRVENPHEALRLVVRAFGPGVTYADVGFLQRRLPAWLRVSSQWRHGLGRVVREALDAFRPSLFPEFCRRAVVQRDHVYFQEFIPGNPSDTRVVVIGDRAFGLSRRNRPDDFRASGSNQMSADPSDVDPRCVRAAFDIAHALQVQSAALDFLIADGAPLVTEISFIFGDAGLAISTCPGHWRSDGSWVDGPMHPAEAQVLVFLEECRRRKAGQGAA